MPATYPELDAQIQNNFGEGHYQAVLDLASNGVKQFPNERPTLDYWRMCAAARLNDATTGCRILGQALAGGFWYGEAVLRQSPSFKPLQGQAEFERLVETCRDRQMAEAGEPVLRVLTPAKVEESPLFVALHGNGSSANNTRPFWQPAVAQGWLVAMPQSSQLMWKGSSIWTEPETAKAEVLPMLETLRAEHSYDPNRVVVAGHSMGGETAMWLAITGAIHSRGFVAIGPGGPLCDEPETWRPILEAQATTGLRGYIIIGDADNLILQDKIHQVAKEFAQAGIACEVEVVKGATHDPHPGYEAALVRGLEYVVNT